jgi:hypothetical protein
MTERARKPGEPVSPDDPSIPVLTERLTLPPLDLNLDFRLPERPAPGTEPTQAPLTELPSMEEPSTEVPLTETPLSEFPVSEVPFTEGPALDIATPLPDDASGSGAVAELNDDATLLAPLEPAGGAPRVPTSLLVSNLEALLPTPPASGPRHEPEIDLTQADGLSAHATDAELREMILLELARRLPTEVETIVRRHLDGAIEEAVRRFAAEARIALAGSLREIVDRAVRSELDRIKAWRR